MNYRPDMGEKMYTFDDVQGVEEAKDEVQEVVEFLKNSDKFQRLGARLPTGGCGGVIGGVRCPYRKVSYRIFGLGGGAICGPTKPTSITIE